MRGLMSHASVNKFSDNQDVLKEDVLMDGRRNLDLWFFGLSVIIKDRNQCSDPEWVFVLDQYDMRSNVVGRTGW